MSDNKEIDLDALFGGTAEKQKKPQQPKQNQGGGQQLRGAPQASKMRDTFRIPFVYRVKKRVLNAMLVLPIFTVYMMFAHHYSWDMGTKTYLLALSSFMLYGGAYFFVSMIDPEDWRAVEKQQKTKGVESY